MAASVVLSYRSDTTTSCRYSLGNGTINLSGFYIPTLTTTSSAIGGTELFLSSSTMLLQDLNMLNLTSTFSILTRIRPTQVASRGIYSLGLLRNNKIGVGMTAGHLIGNVYNDVGTAVLNAVTITGGTPSQFTTTGGHMDVVTVFNFNTTTSAVTTYINATVTSTLNLSAGWKTGAALSGREISHFSFGHLETWTLYSGGVNEIVMWNKALTATTIAAMPLVSTSGVTSTGSLNGSSRTDWVDVGARDAFLWTSITAAQIKSGVTQTQAGLPQAGSYLWNTITAANIKFGVHTIQDSATITGSYQWSALAAGNIKSGVNQIQDGVTVTGTYLWSTIPASVIKYNVSTTQDSANIVGTYQWDTLPATDIRFGVNHIQDGVTFTGSLVSEIWSTITAAEIKLGVNQIQNSVTITGTLASEVWTTITAAEIRNGVNQIQNSVTVTGTFVGETWSTLAASYIASGQNQIQNGVTITGTLLYPVAVSGTAGTVDIANIKENIRYILSANNTSTGAPVGDLSNGLSNRVQDIYKIHPEKVLLGGHQMPALTTYLTSKTIQAKTIAANQVAAKREADLTFSIVGLVTNQIVPNTYTSDQLDEDIEYLMENVEKVLRNYSTIGGYTRWSFPNSVTYHSSSLDERNQLRVGILDLQCKVFY